MPEKQTLERAREDAREGKSPSTQAGEFVREEMHHIREGKHGAKSTKQAIAIGLSKARRSGVKLRSPRRGSAKTKAQASRDSKKGQSRSSRGTSSGGTSKRRSRASSGALKRQGHRAASRSSLSRQARTAAPREAPLIGIAQPARQFRPKAVPAGFRQLAKRPALASVIAQGDKSRFRRREQGRGVSLEWARTAVYALRAR